MDYILHEKGINKINANIHKFITFLLVMSDFDVYAHS